MQSSIEISREKIEGFLKTLRDIKSPNSIILTTAIHWVQNQITKLPAAKYRVTIETIEEKKKELPHVG